MPRTLTTENVIQVFRGTGVNSVPANGSLFDGEFAVNYHTNPPRLWVGDATGNPIELTDILPHYTLGNKDQVLTVNATGTGIIWKAPTVSPINDGGDINPTADPAGLTHTKETIYHVNTAGIAHAGFRELAGETLPVNAILMWTRGNHWVRLDDLVSRIKALLPADAAGVLTNDGAGALSWEVQPTPIAPFAATKSYSRYDFITFNGVLYFYSQTTASVAGESPLTAPAKWSRYAPDELPADVDGYLFNDGAGNLVWQKPPFLKDLGDIDITVGLAAQATPLAAGDLVIGAIGRVTKGGIAHTDWIGIAGQTIPTNANIIVDGTDVRWFTGSQTPATATTTKAGIVEIATKAEAIAGTMTDRAVTPKNVADVFADKTTVASTGVANAADLVALDATGTFDDSVIKDATVTQKGQVELATDVETLAMTDTERAITPSNLAASAVNITTGAADAGKLVLLNAAGLVDPTMVSVTGIAVRAPIDPSAAGTNAPAKPNLGDIHFISADGQLDGTGWTGLTTPVDVKTGDMLMWADARWYVLSGQADLALYLPLAGGTLTGPLTLNADPTTNLGAATKQYVDNNTTGRKGSYSGTTTGGVLTQVSATNVAVVRTAQGKYTATITGGLATDMVIATPDVGFWVAEDITAATATTRLFEFYDGTNIANTLADPSAFRVEVLK